MKVLMMDVDGVIVRGRPGDGKHQFTDLERDLGLKPEVLQQEFFKPFWKDIVTGQEPLLDRLTLVLSEIAPELDAEALIDYWFKNDSRLDSALLDALKVYRQDGIKIFLATNQEHLRAAYLMDDLGLAAHVDGIIYSAELGYKKPVEEFYRLAGEAANALPHEIVLIDDTPKNVEAAKAFGWRAARWTSDMVLDEVLAPFAVKTA